LLKEQKIELKIKKAQKSLHNASWIACFSDFVFFWFAGNTVISTPE
jgi:hypothetical protein